jgi:hypothetical protein
VSGELVGLGRSPAPLEIFRGGDQVAGDRADLPRDQARLGEAADADRQVEAFFDQIDQAFGADDVELDVRILLGELAEREELARGGCDGDPRSREADRSG